MASHLEGHVWRKRKVGSEGAALMGLRRPPLRARGGPGPPAPVQVGTSRQAAPPFPSSTSVYQVPSECHRLPGPGERACVPCLLETAVLDEISPESEVSASTRDWLPETVDAGLGGRGVRGEQGMGDGAAALVG